MIMALCVSDGDREAKIIEVRVLLSRCNALVVASVCYDDPPVWRKNPAKREKRRATLEDLLKADTTMGAGEIRGGRR